jgi:signal transduction histidine kinase
MSERETRQRRSRRRPRRGWCGWQEWEERPDRRARSGRSQDRPLSVEERAERKVQLTGELIRFGLVALALVVFVPPIGIIVLLCWGYPLGRRAYRHWFEPRLRERFIREEVEQQVHASLSHERRELEGDHARSVEQLSASIAHEIRNPITAAKSLVQQMEEDPTAVENVEYARVALEELQRVERSISHLLRFARDEEMSLGEVRMSEVIDSAVETFRDRLERSGIELERRLDCEGALEGDAEQLRRVTINLVGNAVEALEESGTPRPRVLMELGENLAGTEVWMRVSDNGPGLDPEARGKLFSPFYTSKEAGTGLGLGICKKLVEAHRGSIEVASDPGSGAAFVVTLPKAPASRGAGP